MLSIHRNFLLILDTVLERDHHLFGWAELDTLTSLIALPELALRLWVRLFNRKGPYFRSSRLRLVLLSRRWCDLPTVRHRRNIGAQCDVALVTSTASMTDCRGVLMTTEAHPPRKAFLFAYVPLRRTG